MVQGKLRWLFVFKTDISQVCVSNIYHDLVNVIEMLYCTYSVQFTNIEQVVRVKIEKSPACFGYYSYSHSGSKR